MNARFALLCGLTLAAGGARAQAPPALNAPASLADAALEGDAVAADTTAPWRYFPLDSGRVWEYELDDGFIQRNVVVGDTLAHGRRYALFLEEIANAAGALTYSERYPLRYDTASASVRVLVPDGREVPFAVLGCPLDAPFGATLLCETGYEVYVSGTYEGVLVFGGVEAGTGTDTVRTAVKRYLAEFGIETRLAAGVGLALEEGEGGYRALRYYRAGDEEHGVSLWPVAGEPDPPRGEDAPFALAVLPNPAWGAVALRLTLPAAGSARVEVVDALGRVVRALDLGVLAAGSREIPLDLAGLPAGVYVARITTGEQAASQSFVVLD